MTAFLFYVALVLTGVYGYGVVFLFVSAMIARSRYQRHKAAADELRPEIAAAVVEFVAGSNNLDRIRAFAASHRADLEECMLQYHATMTGESRDRISELSLELGLVNRWCEDARSKSVARRRAVLSRLAVVASHEPSRRLSGDILLNALEDSDGEARLEAARTLVHSGDMEVVSEVFRAALNQPLIVRAILAEDLRRFALDLCQSAVPEALRSHDSKQLVAVLEMIIAWERALPLAGVCALVHHHDLAVRLAALRALPLTQASQEAAESLNRALGDPSEEVCTAAAVAAGRMKLEASLAALARCLRLGRVDSARAAAAALAALPPRGWETLSELSESANPVTVSAAHEAFERARKAAQGIG